MATALIVDDFELQTPATVHDHTARPMLQPGCNGILQ